jgi:hydrogenase-4 component E
MPAWLDVLIVLLVLTNLMVLGSSRLGMCIRLVALQGVVIGPLPLLAHLDAITLHTLLLALVSIGLKGAVFPYLLSRAIREADVRREIEPFIGYTASFVVGVLVFAVAAWLGSRLPLPVASASSLLVSGALFSVMVGLFLIVSRRRAVNQVLGYLILENGIFVFGATLAHQEPLLVELGVLLDVFMAVFVMGITLFHINREFDHIDADRLITLRDWPG